MTILTTAARGHVTLRKDVLQYLGIRPGEEIELEKMPGSWFSVQTVTLPMA